MTKSKSKVKLIVLIWFKFNLILKFRFLFEKLGENINSENSDKDAQN